MPTSLPTPQVAASPELTASASRRSALLALLRGLLCLACLLGLAPTASAALAVDVEIAGVDGDALANVRAYLTIEQQRSDPGLNIGRLRRYHQKAPAEIAEALQPFGYYHAETRATLSERDGRWLARYEIAPGPPIIVDRLAVALHGDGADDEALRRLVAEFPLHEGDILDQRLYTRGKEAFQRAASERGYFDFVFDVHTLAINTTTNRAAVQLTANTGARYRFGDVRYHQDVLRERFLVRFAQFEPGDPFDINKLLDLQSALFDSDYFANVEINPQRDEAADLEVPIDVHLTPRPRHRYTLGGGYGTDTGARARAGWENRRINDRGHRFRTDYQWSEVRESLSTRYGWPIRNPRTDEIALTTSWLDDRSTEDNDSEILAVMLSHTYARPSDWVQTLYLRYQNENYTSTNPDDPDPQLLDTDAKLLMPGATWTRVIADRRIYPSRGIRFLFDVRGAHPSLLSNRTFMQLRFQTKAVTTLAQHHRFILRGDVGNTRFQSAAKLPPSVLFFAGGSQSVRGYDFNSLGTIDETTGRLRGGSRMLVASAEYEYRFTDKWSGALFYDTGNAMDNWQDALKQGAGFGVRWLSPIGAVRIDYAWAISEPGMPQQLHINVGPDL